MVIIKPLCEVLESGLGSLGLCGKDGLTNSGTGKFNFLGLFKTISLFEDSFARARVYTDTSSC